MIHQVIGNIIRTFELETNYMDEDNPWKGILSATAFAVCPFAAAFVASTKPAMVRSLFWPGNGPLPPVSPTNGWAHGHSRCLQCGGGSYASRGVASSPKPQHMVGCTRFVTAYVVLQAPERVCYKTAALSLPQPTSSPRRSCGFGAGLRGREAGIGVQATEPEVP